MHRYASFVSVLSALISLTHLGTVCAHSGHLQREGSLAGAAHIGLWSPSMWIEVKGNKQDAVCLAKWRNETFQSRRDN